MREVNPQPNNKEINGQSIWKVYYVGNCDVLGNGKWEQRQNTKFCVCVHMRVCAQTR